MSVASRPRVKRTAPPSSAPTARSLPSAADESFSSAALETLFDLRRPPGYFAADRQVALLRRRRTPPYDQLFIDFRGSQVLTELQVVGQLAWRGAWRWQAAVDGQTLAAAGKWEEVCWHTDADVDYLELELLLTGGWKLQRQMLLARKDEFLLLADAIVGNEVPRPTAESPKIHYECSLPLVAGVQLAPAAETREGLLQRGERKLASVLPLALPEWRAEIAHSSLAMQDSELTLSQAAQGRNLYAPLFFDLARARQRKPLTWRRLTVADQLEIVPRDAAVGYRVQVGDWQWLIYRSLGALSNRTVLGQNYATEFVVCRFNRNGTTADILEIK